MPKNEKLDTKRHSLAHIMAASIQEMFPEAKFGVGPVVEDGFYYDVFVSRPLTTEDLQAIEKRMREKVKQNLGFERAEMPIDAATDMFGKMSQDFKVELLGDLKTRGTTAVADLEDANLVGGNVNEVSVYKTGTFTDLCRGPHVNSTKEIDPESFRLTRVSGAYWRGNQEREQMQRVYGVAFDTKKELEDYFVRLEEAKKRDHRKLGQELDLFSIHPDTVGGGLVLWHPKGGLIRHIAEEYCKQKHLEAGYDFVYTPHIGRASLWETSGHLGFYAENMYAPIKIEEQLYYLKPMNCPFHLSIYKSSRRSYRDLPMRFAEWGTVYRFERSGVLHGLTRVRGFTQDDAHLFCRPDQMPEEIERVLNFSLDILRAFGFDQFELYLSTRPPKRVGREEDWDVAEAALEDTLKKSGIKYNLNPGDGAFYGPKIDLVVNDAIGRPWQLSTVQFDFNEPERFDLSYVGEDGAQHRPFMIHRALMGSVERFFGLLLEHHGGALPVWLSPVQAMLIPIADRHVDYCKQVQARLKAAGLRADIDAGTERMNAKIRNAQMQKIPYMLVVGDREQEQGAVSVRLRSGEDLKSKPVDEFLGMAKEAVASKK
ncbi:MAG TPA: threonine--tRNA ligase [Terriglobia bacterium]|nr:threonine--tRNA ligase [Terriglobia bacterium]